ncbi:hypothetical protein F0562_015068 [Nyssa sinensis]|uniref:Uncharacterized protein n=1 Tax=Nyssa sinensis TaxID=561372 RepID=A0A5J4ZIE2_9ASTE|nr:hypothetical protein F0562_015068 [Nyssa sinensis]
MSEDGSEEDISSDEPYLPSLGEAITEITTLVANEAEGANRVNASPNEVTVDLGLGVPAKGTEAKGVVEERA